MRGWDSPGQGVARMPLSSKGTQGWRPVPIGLFSGTWLLVPGMEMSGGPKRNTKRDNFVGDSRSHRYREEREERQGKNQAGS